MEPLLSKLASLLPTTHLLAYGTLLGTDLYQTFILTGLSYRALPRSHFRTLQKKVFPAYFRAQVLLSVAVAVTHPPKALLSLVHDWKAWVPVAAMVGTAGLNWVVYGPRTEKAMMGVVHQETRNGREGNKMDGEDSQEMRAAKRRFSREHAMSIHINLINICLTVWYGWGLGSKLEFK